MDLNKGFHGLVGTHENPICLDEDPHPSSTSQDE
jgi:hypothetical protein